jgi:muramoyltetrapeptide carboxypeptidase
LTPPPLRAGDKVRLVSPASSTDREFILQRARILESWGLKVDFGEHAFKKLSYLAGTDEERLSDLNAAFSDPEVRAIYTTGGGKGSYRIADGIDFDAVRRDPKFLIGFSDINILHLCLWKHCRLISVHGALYNPAGPLGETEECLRQVLMTAEPIIVRAREEEATSTLTTTGRAAGRLLGGNYTMMATAAGWALPSLAGAILLIEGNGEWQGEIDRRLTMLRKAGHFDGLAGIAVGQFAGFKFNVVELLRDHLDRLGVPILGGLPLGHGDEPLSVPIGAMATFDTVSRELVVRPD